jgi:hypothetical protein
VNSDAPIIERALCEAFKVQAQLTLTDAYWLRARLADACPPSPTLSVVLAAAELGIPKRLFANRRNPEFAASQAVVCLERERAIQADAARRAVAIWAAALNVPLTQQVKSCRPRTSASTSLRPFNGPLPQPAKSSSSSAPSSALPSQQPIVPRQQGRVHRFKRFLFKCVLLYIISYIVFVVGMSLKNSNSKRAREKATSSDVLTQPKNGPHAIRLHIRPAAAEKYVAPARAAYGRHISPGFTCHRGLYGSEDSLFSGHETRQQLAILEKDRNHIAHEREAIKQRATAAELPARRSQELQMALNRAIAQRDAITSERDHAMERAEDLQAMLDRTFPKLQEYENRDTASPRIATYSNGRAEGKITKLTEEDHHMFEARLNTSPAVESYEVSTTAWPEGSLGVVYADGQRVGSFRVHISRHNLIVGRTIENCDLRLGDEVHVSPQ